MGGYNKELIKLLKEAGCRFDRQGKDDYEISYSPITRLRFVLDRNVKSRHTANKILKDAGLGKTF